MNNPTSPHPHVATPRRRRAFTLIELILVLVILGVLITIAAPAFQAMAEGTGVKDCSTQLLALTQYARSQAIAEGVNYRLVVDAANRTYYLTKQDGYDYIELGEEVGREHVFPDGIDVQLDDAYGIQQTQDAAAGTGQVIPDREVANLPYVEFKPSGRTDPSLIKVTDRNGRITQVVCQSATESFRLLTSDVATKR